MWEVEDAPGWLLDRLSTESYEILIRLAMTLWDIWFFRNKKVWKNRVVTSSFAMEWSLKQLKDWRDANEKKTKHGATGNISKSKANLKWIAPETGCFKLNVDVSIGQESSSFAVGWVLRDQAGGF